MLGTRQQLSIQCASTSFKTYLGNNFSGYLLKIGAILQLHKKSQNSKHPLDQSSKINLSLKNKTKIPLFTLHKLHANISNFYVQKLKKASCTPLLF